MSDLIVSSKQQLNGLKITNCFAYDRVQIVIPFALKIFQMVRCSLDRSSRLEVFCKRGVLKSFAKFTGKHLCQSLLFLNKVAGLRTAILLKERLWHRYFPVNFAKFLRTSFLTEHLRWLLLSRGRQHKSLYKLSLKRSFNTL